MAIDVSYLRCFELLQVLFLTATFGVVLLLCSKKAAPKDSKSALSSTEAKSKKDVPVQPEVAKNAPVNRESGEKLTVTQTETEKEKDKETEKAKDDKNNDNKRTPLLTPKDNESKAGSPDKESLVQPPAEEGKIMEDGYELLGPDKEADPKEGVKKEPQQPTDNKKQQPSKSVYEKDDTKQMASNPNKASPSKEEQKAPKAESAKKKKEERESEKKKRTESQKSGKAKTKEDRTQVQII